MISFRQMDKGTEKWMAEKVRNLCSKVLLRFKYLETLPFHATPGYKSHSQLSKELSPKSRLNLEPVQISSCSNSNIASLNVLKSGGCDLNIHAGFSPRMSDVWMISIALEGMQLWSTQQCCQKSLLHCRRRDTKVWWGWIVRIGCFLEDFKYVSIELQLGIASHQLKF